MIKINNRNYIIVIVILSISIIIVYFQAFPHQETGSYAEISNFPDSIDGWDASKTLHSEPSFKSDRYSGSLIKEYVNREGDTIKLSIVYSDKSRKAIHPPEIGLMGEGKTIINKSDNRITSQLIATKIIIESSKSKDLLVYWYKVGDMYTRSYIKQQVKLILDRILLKKSSIALITVSIRINEVAADYAFGKVKEFCNLIEPLLEHFMP